MRASHAKSSACVTGELTIGCKPAARTGPRVVRHARHPPVGGPFRARARRDPGRPGLDPPRLVHQGVRLSGENCSPMPVGHPGLCPGDWQPHHISLGNGGRLPAGRHRHRQVHGIAGRSQKRGLVDDAQPQPRVCTPSGRGARSPTSSAIPTTIPRRQLLQPGAGPALAITSPSWGPCRRPRARVPCPSGGSIRIRTGWLPPCHSRLLQGPRGAVRVEGAALRCRRQPSRTPRSIGRCPTASYRTLRRCACPGRMPMPRPCSLLRRGDDLPSGAQPRGPLANRFGHARAASGLPGAERFSPSREPAWRPRIPRASIWCRRRHIALRPSFASAVTPSPF